MFELSASAGDHVELAGVVNSDTAGTVEDTTTVVVRTRSAIVTTAIETLTELLEALQECGEPADRLRPLTTKLTAARQHLQRARTAVDRGDTARATDAISTPSTRIGAILNHLATREMADCFADTPHVHRTLRNRTEFVIDHLTDAAWV